MRSIVAFFVLSLFVSMAFGADSASTEQPPTASAEVVKMLFRTAGAFRVAQAATVPISVTHGASFIPFDPIENPAFALAPNTFASVFGRVGGGGVSQESGRLLPAGPTNDWGDDFVNGRAPTSLDGVRVLVNGNPAFLSFIGRAEEIGAEPPPEFDQINFLAPDDDTQGLVSFEVFNGGEMVAASMVNLSAVSPGLFAFPPRDGDNAQFVVAVEATRPDLFFLPPEFFPGRETRPARSGELVTMFGTGFGATDPPMPAGQIPTELSVIPDGAEVLVMIGGLKADLSFAGLAPCCAGLFQFNATIPQLPNGNHLVTIERDGVSSQAGLSLIVENE